MDPTNDAVISRLMQISRELTERGFREICFTSFQFPNGDDYVFDSGKSKDQVIAEAAAEISEYFAKSDVIVSFITGRADFPVAGGRVFIPNTDGSQVEYYVNAYGQAENCREIVFMSNSKDARYEKQAILRPLMAE